MSKASKFLTDLASYEAAHKTPRNGNIPQIKGRTAFVLIAVLLLFLLGFTYYLMESGLSPRMIDRLESVLFGIAALAGSLRIYYAGKKYPS
jgi:hypothetical protein